MYVGKTAGRDRNKSYTMWARRLGATVTCRSDHSRARQGGLPKAIGGATSRLIVAAAAVPKVRQRSLQHPNKDACTNVASHSSAPLASLRRVRRRGAVLTVGLAVPQTLGAAVVGLCAAYRVWLRLS
jgi:hypothetical protein